MSKYKITGVDRSGKRFRMFYNCKFTALCINLWCGNVWEKQDNGKWKCIRSVYN